MEIDRSQLKRAFRNGWILLVIAALFTVLFFLFTLDANEDHPAVEWDMGGVPFVPASSVYANGYYTGGEPSDQGASIESE
jgi:hypothetical protein